MTNTYEYKLYIHLIYPCRNIVTIVEYKHAAAQFQLEFLSQNIIMKNGCLLKRTPQGNIMPMWKARQV